MLIIMDYILIMRACNLEVSLGIFPVLGNLDSSQDAAKVLGHYYLV